MVDQPEGSPLSREWPELEKKVRARTPARLLVGRAGPAYRTATQLDLRKAHAGARDAVRAELELPSNFGMEFVAEWNLFELCSLAGSKEEYLLRPDLGRRFSEESRAELSKRYAGENVLGGNDLQVAIGDGLSVTAVSAQVPSLLPLIYKGAKARGWSIGAPFVIRHCRVGLLNEIGELLTPKVVILLIGERPGLATQESLSAYMAYRPQKGHSDADRNLISNIHSRGVSADHAAARIVALAAQMMALKISGYQLREDSSAVGPGDKNAEADKSLPAEDKFRR